MSFLKSSLVIAWLIIALSCSSNDGEAPINCASSSLTLTVEAVRAASDCQVNDGSIAILVSGGEAPYSLFLNEAAVESNAFANLFSGIYTILVKDSRGCERRADNVIVTANNFAFSADVIANSSCTGGNGAISIDVETGQPPFQYRLNNSPPTAESTFSNLKDGTYALTILDAAECSSVLTLAVPKVATGVSWKDDVRPIVVAKCATTGCHNGVSRTDLRIYEKAKQHAADMKRLTQNGSMPFDGEISKDQIALIACWVDEGAQNN